MRWSRAGAGPQVLVVTTNGQLSAKAVIVTVPTGVLASGPLGFASPVDADATTGRRSPARKWVNRGTPIRVNLVTDGVAP